MKASRRTLRHGPNTERRPKSHAANRAEGRSNTAAQSPLVSLRQWSVRRFAVVGIAAQFLALVRILSEVFRIKHFDVARYGLVELEPFIGAALFTAVLVALAVATFALGRVRVALTIAVFNIVALFVYKVALM
jgi:hypothetical protein